MKEGMEPVGFRPAATKDLVLHLQPRGRQTYSSASDAFGSRWSICPWLTRIALGRQPGSSTLSSGMASPAEGPWGPLNHTSQGSQMDLAELCWTSPLSYQCRLSLSLLNLEFTLMTALYTLLEKEMATHSGVFVYRILWMEEPGGLLCMGSCRVRHD